MNVKPKNYSWPNLYEHVLDLNKYTFSWRAIINRYRATKAMIPRWMNVVRTVSSQGFGMIKYYTEVHRRLEADPQFRGYFEQKTTELPQFYVDRVRRDQGPLWEWLPETALYHDPNAYLKSLKEQSLTPLSVRTATGSRQARRVVEAKTENPVDIEK